MEAEQLPSTSGKPYTFYKMITQMSDFLRRVDLGFMNTSFEYSVANLSTIFFSKSMFAFLTVFVNDGSNCVPVMSTPVRAGRPVPRFASPSHIGMPSADSDRYYF